MQSLDVQRRDKTHSLSLGHFGVEEKSGGVNKETEKKISQAENENKVNEYDRNQEERIFLKR